MKKAIIMSMTLLCSCVDGQQQSMSQQNLYDNPMARAGFAVMGGQPMGDALLGIPPQPKIHCDTFQTGAIGSIDCH